MNRATVRRRAQVANQLRDVLFQLAMKKWQEDGWAVRPHYECRQAAHSHKADLAISDTDEHLVHVYPHQVEKDQPVAKTVVHEVFGHILLELDGSKRDEALAQPARRAAAAVAAPRGRGRARAHLAEPAAAAPCAPARVPGRARSRGPDPRPAAGPGLVLADRLAC